MTTILPKVSFCIITFNQQNYIREAIESAFSQDYKGEIEYIISDDGSFDKTFEVINDVITLYKKDNVLINRHNKNVGIAGNVNWVFNHATGDYIVLAGGDDVFLPSRVSKVIDYFISNPGAIIVDCGYNVMDSSGKVWLTVDQNAGSIYTIKDLTPWTKIWCNGCSRTIHRKLLSFFPDLNSDVSEEDAPIIVRALLGNGEIHVIGIVLVNYRVHENNLSNAKNVRHYNRAALSRQYMDDFRSAVKNKYIPIRYYITSWLYIKKYTLATILLKSNWYIRYIQPLKKAI
jgi:glycosyltransferase involved in cell wall biosynthesis